MIEECLEKCVLCGSCVDGFVCKSAYGFICESCYERARHLYDMKHGVIWQVNSAGVLASHSCRRFRPFFQLYMTNRLEEIYKGRQGRPSEKHGQNDRDLSQKGETRDLVAQDLGLGNGKTWERLKEKVTTVRKYSPTIEKRRCKKHDG